MLKSISGVLLSLSLTLSLAAHVSGYVQQKGARKIIEELRSRDWRTRDLAIAKLKRGKVKMTSELRGVLLKVLAKEADEYGRIRQRFKETGEPGGEEYGEYVRDFLDVIVPLVDEQAVPYLVELMDLGDDIVRRLVSFGRPAFEPVLEKLGDTTIDVKAIQVIGAWLTTKAGEFLLSGEREEVKRRLIEKAWRDSRPEVKLSAIKALSDAGDLRAYDLFFEYVFKHVTSVERPWLRETSLRILGDWLKSGALRGRLKAVVKNKVISMALSDPAPYVRIEAVRLLAELGGADVKRVLERIAREDAASWRDAAGRTIYPVREAAVQALQRLRPK